MIKLGTADYCATNACYQWEKCSDDNVKQAGYKLYMTPVYDGQRVAATTSWYQIVGDFRVVKMTFEPKHSYWQAVEIGEYIYFPSETLYVFVNHTKLDDASPDEFGKTSNGARCVSKVRYCAHRSHTPSTNFSEVLHREPVLEEWPKLMKSLQNLEKNRRIDDTINMVQKTCKRYTTISNTYHVSA